MLTSMIFKATIKVIEKHGWGEGGKEMKIEFLKNIQTAHKAGALSDKDAFDLTMRAMKVI